MKKHPSIFNDVLAPITTGPSSSNTCGPYRIGRIMRDLLLGKPVSLIIKMARYGGFFDTFYSMQSDKAFLTGVLGEDLLSFDLNRAYRLAEERELRYDFLFTEDMEVIPSEMAEIVIESAEDKLTLTAVSLGGGEIIISRLNDFATDIDGKQYAMILETGTGLKTVKSAKPFTPEEIRLLSEKEQALVCRLTEPVYPVIVSPDAVPPFSTSEEMLAYTAENDIPIWQAALNYESALCNLPEDAVWKIAEETLTLSYRSIELGYQENITFDGVTTAKARDVKKHLSDGDLISLGTADGGISDALSIMEFSNSHGTIVCMPTGGSSGIIPALIKNTAENLGASKEAQVKALLTAGLIGVFYYPTHYTGAIGCQAEIGVAISMGAASAVSFKSDSAVIAEKAAVMGVQSVLGMVCDPIDGFVQVPCFIRNMTAIPTALTCANGALCGLDTLVSLDEMVEAVLRVGEKLRTANNLGTCMCKR